MKTYIIFYKKIINSGRGGIRTHEEKFSLVFKTRAFDHSATLPSASASTYITRKTLY
jgi:hypothetical protein